MEEFSFIHISAPEGTSEFTDEISACCISVSNYKFHI